MAELGSREVALTFTNYELPKGVTPEEQARRIAIFAFKASAFARESDKTEVIFEEGSEAARVSRRYSFGGEELAVGEAPSPEATYSLEAGSFDTLRQSASLSGLGMCCAIWRDSPYSRPAMPVGYRTSSSGAESPTITRS